MLPSYRAAHMKASGLAPRAPRDFHPHSRIGCGAARRLVRSSTPWLALGFARGLDRCPARAGGACRDVVTDDVVVSVLALVLGDRPRRTGLWFYLGALTATLAIGVIAAFVIGDIAASDTPSQPKTWVAIVDIVAAIVLAIWMVRVLRRPPDPKRVEGIVAQMSKVASSPVIAIIGAAAALAIQVSLSRLRSRTSLKLIRARPSTSSTGFSSRWCHCCRWRSPSSCCLWHRNGLTVLSRRRGTGSCATREVAAVIVFLLVASLLRDGIAGLTN